MNRNQLKDFIYEYDKMMTTWRKRLKHRCNGIRRLNQIFHDDLDAYLKAKEKHERGGGVVEILPDLTDKIVEEFKHRLVRHGKNGRGYAEEEDRDVNIIFCKIAQALAKEARFDPAKPSQQAERRLLYFTLTAQVKNTKLLDGKTDALNLPGEEVFITDTGQIFHLERELFPLIDQNALTNQRTGKKFSPEDEGFILAIHIYYKNKPKEEENNVPDIEEDKLGENIPPEDPIENKPKRKSHHYTLKEALKYQRQLVEYQIAEQNLQELRDRRDGFRPL